jgi:2-furoate---CoA ligase
MIDVIVIAVAAAFCQGNRAAMPCGRDSFQSRREIAYHGARRRDVRMLDLGLSFVASVARDSQALAIVDGEVRLTYAQWYRRISALVEGLDALGLKPGDHLVTALTNRWEAATLHWACQFAGLIITPVNWRSSASELDFFLSDADAKAIAYEEVSAQAVASAAAAKTLPRIALDAPSASDTAFAELAARVAPDAQPRADAEAWSVMLYTSGTTAQPKGVPRRQRAERAAALAHVAQNLYGRGERTLGVMPLYHTMGVRSLLAMSLIGGAFVCLRRFDVEHALQTIAAERITNLYLVPTLYHDLVHHPMFATTDVTSVRKLGFAGAPMTDGLLKELQAAFKPDLFVNHYGSSEIYTFTIDQNAPAKPGSAGRAGINQMVRVVKLGAQSVDEIAAAGEEGEIIALLAGDESFEGYWRRPEADPKAIRQGWYFTGDTGFADADGDIFVTGRVDDMIISGGENISPVEIESCLSLHEAVSEVAVVGLPDERWGRTVTAFIQRRAAVEPDELDAFCRKSGLAAFKRPRRYVFVAEIPKSPVGKLLRRKLVAGDYVGEKPEAHQQGTAA